MANFWVRTVTTNPNTSLKKEECHLFLESKQEGFVFDFKINDWDYLIKKGIGALILICDNELVEFAEAVEEEKKMIDMGIYSITDSNFFDFSFTLKFKGKKLNCKFVFKNKGFIEMKEKIMDD